MRTKSAIETKYLQKESRARDAPDLASLGSLAQFLAVLALDAARLQKAPRGGDVVPGLLLLGGGVGLLQLDQRAEEGRLRRVESQGGDHSGQGGRGQVAAALDQILQEGRGLLA